MQTFRIVFLKVNGQRGETIVTAWSVDHARQLFMLRSPCDVLSIAVA